MLNLSIFAQCVCEPWRKCSCLESYKVVWQINYAGLHKQQTENASWPLNLQLFTQLEVPRDLHQNPLHPLQAWQNRGVINIMSKKVIFVIDHNLELISANFPSHSSLQRVTGFSGQLLTIGEWCLHSVTLVSCFSLARWEVMNPLRAWPAYAPYTFAFACTVCIFHNI